MNFLKNSLKKMILNKKSLLLFALSFFLVGISTVDAYYDDDGNYYTLLFENTPLRTFVTRDFALNYKYRDYLDSTDIAIIESTSNSGTYTFRKAFDKNKEILKVIYQIPDNLKNTYGYQYVMYAYPDYVTGNPGAITPTIMENKILNRAVSGQHLVYQKQTFIKNYTLVNDVYNMLNFDVNNYGTNISIYEKANTGLSPDGNSVLIIAVKTDGQIEVFSDIYNRKSQKWLYTAMQDSNTAPSKNLIYSSADIYHINTGELLVKKEEFEIRSIISNYTLTCDENDPFIYNIQIMIQNLKDNDNVKIYKDNTLIKDDIMEDPEENEYIQINDAESGLYKIEVYDENDELIHENEFDIVVDSITIDNEDDTISLIGKVKDSLNNFRRSLDFLYQGWNTVYNELNREMKTGILVIISIIAISIIFKLLNK